ncbi:hypothetical protein MKX01_004922 [Papaver californicum]|nr:hypothetical protein MKX01_004922 [Papaver californicum]
MTFWGVEIKPGKPFILDSHRGKIQITQATLGTPGTLAKRSVVQCNVGDKSPVLLCALLPDKIESLPLNLQFDEEDDVTFSVLGPRSVHLTGFYCGSGSGDRDDDDSDSYGEDIVETDNEADQSADSEEEDEVSDFIDDGDTETFPPSKGRKSADDDEKPVNHKHPKKKYQVSDSDVDEVIVAKDHARFKVSESEDGDIDEKPANRKGSHKHLKKKYQVSNSDVDDEVIVVKDHARCEVHESEDEDIDEKPANNHKRLKKKYQVSDSDVDDEEIVVKDHARSEVSESKDEDLLPISHLIKKKATTESKGDANCNSEIQLGKESKEGNGSSDPAAFKKLNQDSHIQVSKTEQISESPKVSSTPSTDIGQESNVQAKKKKKRSRGEDVDAKTEQTDHDRVELKPKEEQPTAMSDLNC